MLGIGDALVVNDPLTAPGANSAAKAADAYLSAIRAHGDAPYDRAFMDWLVSPDKAAAFLEQTALAA